MNPSVSAPVAPPEPAFLLSEVLGARVLLAGKRIGKLADLVIKENGTLPSVTHIYVAMPFGTSAVIPWDAIRSIGPKEVDVQVSDLASLPSEPDEKAVLLKDHILDKKAIDLDGRDLEVVYDVRLVRKNNRLYVSEVDLSRYGLLRRMGLTGLAKFI